MQFDIIMTGLHLTNIVEVTLVGVAIFGYIYVHGRLAAYQCAITNQCILMI